MGEGQRSSQVSFASKRELCATWSSESRKSQFIFMFVYMGQKKNIPKFGEREKNTAKFGDSLQNAFRRAGRKVQEHLFLMQREQFYAQATDCPHVGLQQLTKGVGGNPTCIIFVCMYGHSLLNLHTKLGWIVVCQTYRVSILRIFSKLKNIYLLLTLPVQRFSHLRLSLMKPRLFMLPLGWNQRH